MTTSQLTAPTAFSKGFASFEGFRRVDTVKFPSFAPLRRNSNRTSPALVVQAATTVAAKFTSLRPLGDRVLLKIKIAEEKTVSGILLPTTAQSKPQAGEVVAVGGGHAIGELKVDVSVKAGNQVVYSKYSGIEVELNGESHLIIKEDDIVGILDSDDIKDMKPLNDRVLIKVAETEGKTAGGLILTEASKEKPSIGTVIAVGPGPLDEEGKRTGLSVNPGYSVLYSRYAGNDFKGSDGSEYITLRASDIMAVLS